MPISRAPEFRHPPADIERFSLASLHDAILTDIRLQIPAFDLSLDLQVDWMIEKNVTEETTCTLTFTDAHLMEVVFHEAKPYRKQAKYDPTASDAEQRSRITTSVSTRSVDWKEFVKEFSEKTTFYVYSGELIRNDLGASLQMLVSRNSDSADFTITLSGSKLTCYRGGQILTVEELLKRGWQT